ncbi:hypothetical protein [Nocardioides sp.]|uniref:hypothetical protein n=1 Tax=Nocardioides sp. TaxID=35761 RepID=UPI0025D68FFD|nr:hypothetical protein [Nocardioides sp.]
MSRWRRGVAVLATTVVVGVVAPAVSAVSAAAVPMCQGHRATIVGDRTSPGVLKGTGGDDVIVTRGHYVRSKAGDDRICVTGDATYVTVDAGSGDDRVVVKGSRRMRVHAILGRGQDVYLGGAGRDQVDADPEVRAGHPSPDDELDRVSTRGGKDTVEIGVPRQTTHDVLDLGDGADQVQVYGLLGSDVRPRGGAGTDYLGLIPNGNASEDPPNGNWVIDNALETATVDGVVQSHWDAFEWFTPSDLNAETVRFVGGDAAELLAADHELVSASMGGGDDVVAMGFFGGVQDVNLSGGPGSDTLSVGSRELTVDLAAGELWDESGSADDPQVRFDTFENASGYAGFLRIIGDAQDNVLRAYGCDVVVTGGAGDDRLQATPADPEDKCQGNPGVDFSGEAGSDVLLGGPGPDRLDGGEDHDVAAGRGGIDVCLAEVRRACER